MQQHTNGFYQSEVKMSLSLVHCTNSSLRIRKKAQHYQRSSIRWMAEKLEGKISWKITRNTTCPQTFSIDLRLRNKVTLKDTVGGFNAVTTNMVSAWFETTLPKLLSNHNLRDIFNTGEFGLFTKFYLVKCFLWKRRNFREEK